MTMSLRKLRSHLGILLIALAFGFTVVGCDDEKKDDSEEEDDKDDEDEDDGDGKKAKKKKKKKKKKKGKKGDGGDEPAVAPKKIDVEPPQVDEAAKTQAKAIEGKVDSNKRFSRDLIKDKDNAKAFVHLAATSTKADVTIAALRAMYSGFTSYDKSKDRTLADEDYARAVLMKIQDSDSKIQAEAIRSASHSVSGKTPHVKVVDALVDLGNNHPKPEGRYAAIDVLGNISSLAKNKDWIAPLIKALDSTEPWLVSEALWNLRLGLYNYTDKDGLKDKLVVLLKHADPGVRGRAADTLASLAGFKDDKQKEYGALIEPLLDDSNPYTKSAAMGALASLRYKKAFHKIITFVDDTTKNTYDIKGWTELDGDSGWQHHDGSAWSTVGDAALSAIRSVSFKTKKKFEYKINYKTKDADLKKAATDAKAWYLAVKGELG
jgi:hypothetical protein